MEATWVTEAILLGRSDANIRFSDLRSLLEYPGFEERIRGAITSIGKEGVAEKVNLQRDDGNAKPCQVRQVRRLAVKYKNGKGRLMHKFEIILYWSNEDQVFVAEVPELPGCMAHGDSQEAALMHVNDAMQLWIDTAREFGDPVPQPKGERLMLA